MVVEKAAWQDGALRTTLFEPFEILRHSNQESYRKEKENGGSGRDLGIWLPERTHRFELSNGEFRKSDFLRGVNQRGNSNRRWLDALVRTARTSGRAICGVFRIFSLLVDCGFDLRS